jgi:hypothetical protein
VKNTRRNRQQQKTGVFVMLLLFEIVLVLLQLWLFVSVLEGTVSGGSPIAVTAMFVSLACFAANTWMLIGVRRMDRGG